MGRATAACSGNQAGGMDAGPQLSRYNCRLPCVVGHRLLCCICMSQQAPLCGPIWPPMGGSAGCSKPVRATRSLPCRCVGLGASGRLYVGVNLEFPCLPLHNSVHAEQFLVVNAIQHGERELVKLAVSAAPCGHCRQFLSELCCAVREGAALSCAVHAPRQPVPSWRALMPSQPVARSACQLCAALVNQPLLVAVGTGWTGGAMLEHAAACRAEPHAAVQRRMLCQERPSIG